MMGLSNKTLDFLTGVTSPRPERRNSGVLTFMKKIS